MTTGSPTSEVGAVCKRLRREWPISTRSPHIGSQPVNPDGPEAATLLQSLEARIEELEEGLWFYARENSWRSCTVYMCGHGEINCNAMADRGAKARAALTPSNRDRM